MLSKPLRERGKRIISPLLLVVLSLFSGFLYAIPSQGRMLEGTYKVEPVYDSLSYSFSKPDIPLVIIDPYEQASYYLNHFWDDFDFNRWQNEPEKIATLLFKEFEDFIATALSFPLEESAEALLIPAQRSKGRLATHFFDLYHSLLYEDSHSLYRNDAFFLKVLAWYSTSPSSGIALVERAKALLQLVRRNQPGSHAEDFTFNDSKGQVKRLSEFRGKPTILVFYTPSCQGCMQATAFFKANQEISTRINKGKLNLLYIYPYDDVKSFNSSLPHLPRGAVAGINSSGTIINTPLYDLKLSPTIYLLDMQGVVVLKDCSPQELYHHIVTKGKN